MEEELERIGVRPNKVGVEKWVGRKRRGAWPKKKKKVCPLFW
jgi:hypothetical protein